MSKKYLHIRISGPSASGKTTLAKFFKDHKKNAIDGDLYTGMWIDKNGKRVRANYKKLGKNINKWAEDKEFKWVCDEVKLKKLILKNKNKELYIFGGPAPNNPKQFFDKLFWLHANKNLILKRIKLRLKDKSSYHRYGETKKQRDEILRSLKYTNKKIKAEGYIIMDASLKPNEIFDIICNN